MCATFDLPVSLLVWWQIDENVAREIINHRSLRHPNIIRFKEVCAFLHFRFLGSFFFFSGGGGWLGSGRFVCVYRR